MTHEMELIPPAEGESFDRGEPKAVLIAIIAVICIVALVAVLLVVQLYYQHAREQQVYDKVLAPVGEDLVNLRAREESQLHSYGYVDKAKGQVRLPIERAMELVEKEFAEGKVQYSTKPTPVVKPQDAVGVPNVAATPK